MDKQHLEIGHPLKVAIRWYDKVPEPPEDEVFEGEVVGWRTSQMLVRVPAYSAIRIWKKNGLEVGNPDWRRRGFRVDLSELAKSLRPATNHHEEVEIDLPVATDTGA